MIRFILVFIFSLVPVFASTQIRLEITIPIVKQGSLVQAYALLESDSVQKIELQKLKGLSLADTIYIHQVGPLIRESSGDFKSQMKIVFLKIPTSQTLIHDPGQNEIVIALPKLEVQPTEIGKELLFGNFEVPGKVQIIKWVLGVLIGLVLILAILALLKKRKHRKNILQKKLEIKNKMIAAKEYSEIVQVWLQKETVLSEFPALKDSFKELEKVLFKYQFKATQSEFEKAEVIKAYQIFLSQGIGGLNGI